MLTLTKKERDSISVLRAIGRLQSGEPVDGLLAEINQQLPSFDRMRPCIPWAVLQHRDLNVAGAGADLVSTTPAPAADFLRQYSVLLLNGGAQTLENLSGNTPLPALTGSATGSWLSSETASQAPTDPTFSAPTLVPKTYLAATALSRSIRIAVGQAEPVIRNHLGKLLGEVVDTAALNGSGSSGQPKGLLNVAGTQSQSGTSLAQAGATHMRALAVAGGSDDRNTVFIASPDVCEILQNRERATGSGLIWDDGNKVADKPAFSTRNMPSASMLCGDFSTVVIGFFGDGFELTADPYSGFQKGTVTVRAMISADVGIPFAGSFAKSTSIT